MSRGSLRSMVRVARTIAVYILRAVAAALVIYAVGQVPDLLFGVRPPIWVLAKIGLTASSGYAIWRGSSVLGVSHGAAESLVIARAHALLGWVFVCLLGVFGLGYQLRPQIIDGDDQARMMRIAFLDLSNDWWGSGGPRYVRIDGRDPSPAQRESLTRSVGLEPWSSHPSPSDCPNASRASAAIYSCSTDGLEAWVGFAQWPFWRVATVRWGTSDCSGGALLIRGREWRVIRTWIDFCMTPVVFSEAP